MRSQIMLLDHSVPINLNGRLCAAPIDYVQLTTTTMCVAAVQAVGETRRGWIPLTRDREERITTCYRTHLAARGLRHPDP